MADDEPLAMRLVRLLHDQQAVPEKTLVVVVTLEQDGSPLGVVKVGTTSPIPIRPEVIQAVLLQAAETVGHPGSTHLAGKIIIGKA